MHQRDLPWRKTLDPYHIWLSEIILQQTRVNQGLPYYEAFLKAFPSVAHLAQAEEQEVLKLWQGLGYYSRARNLHATAKIIHYTYQDAFPSTKEGLLTLKGVGDYTASAIASFAFHEPVAVVDGNVQRVFARYCGIDLPINETAGSKLIKEKATQLLNKEQPALHNQAIMEFGALHCKPQNPLCSSCPFSTECVAFQQGKVAELPVKIKKNKIQTRYLAYFILQDQHHQVLIQQRKGKGIWENLYEFPVIESPTKLPRQKLLSQAYEDFGVEEKEFKKCNPKPVQHLLSHRKLVVDFYTNKTPIAQHHKLSSHQLVVNVQELQAFPVPVLIANFIKEFLL